MLGILHILPHPHWQAPPPLLYQFGDGMGYSSFSYSGLRVRQGATVRAQAPPCATQGGGKAPLRLLLKMALSSPRAALWRSEREVPFDITRERGTSLLILRGREGHPF